MFKYLTFFLENLTRVLGLAGVAFQAPASDLAGNGEIEEGDDGEKDEKVKGIE